MSNLDIPSPPQSTYNLGDTVCKKSGGAWHGTIVGMYSTKLTPEGYAVESYFEQGSVQIYPVSALIPWQPTKGTTV